MTQKNILISGASIAGPTLAYWLKQYGFNPTVVERAPGIRSGGYPIDIRDEAVDIVKRMGIWPRLQQEIATVNEVSFMNERGKRISRVRAHSLREILDLDRFWIEVMRGDLATTLYETTKDKVEYLFGDSIKELKQDDEGVDVTFESGMQRRFDLVVGADGLHSRVRSLAFGDEAQFERYCGYAVAIFTTDNYLGLSNETMLIYGVPGKQVVVRSAKDSNTMLACFIFQQPTKIDFHGQSIERQKQLLASVYAGQGWEASRLLEHMNSAADWYFDSVSQIHMDTWFSGRTVLLGDAGYCPALLTGQGTSLAMRGAYILAGELKAAAGDHTIAFQNYERIFRPSVDLDQKKVIAGARSLVPATRLSLWRRTHLLPLLYPLFVVPQGLWKRFFVKSSTVDSYENVSSI